MFEILIASGVNKGQTYFPDSGPGNKSLRKGNSEIGYFGTLSSTELFAGWELSTALGFTAGTVNREVDNTWMKFIYKGKYLFVCKEITRNNLSWNDIYKAGAMYGVKGNGPYPVAGSSKEQFNIMVKEEAGVSLPWKLVIRSLKGANVDPYAGVDYTAFGLAEGNEYNDLIYRLLAVGTNSRPNTGVFETWPGADLGTGTGQNTILQETSSANVANAMARGNTGSTGGITKATVRVAADGWRPVLELIPDGTVVFGPYRPYMEYTGNAGPLSVSGSFVDVVYNPQVLQVDDGGAAKIPYVTSITFVDVAQTPQDVTIANTLTSVSMTFTRT
jgi:hypothetical protein